LKNTALEVLILNNPDGIHELMEMPSAERKEVVAELLVPNGDPTVIQTLNQTLDGLAQDQSKGMTGGDFLVHAQKRLKAAVNQLEPEISRDKVVVDCNKFIGKGGFAEVYAGTLKTGASRTLPVAVKVMDVHPDQVQHYGREVAVLRMISKQHYRVLWLDASTD
jgi:hypothetical protein